MTIEQIAAICHEANKALCVEQGDLSQQPWWNAPEWQRTSAINGVKFHLENPDASVSSSHESWMKEKIETGWEYGPVKDPDKKEHPCMVPFDSLPEKQQAKDHLFKAIVHGLSQFIEK